MTYSTDRTDVIFQVYICHRPQFHSTACNKVTYVQCDWISINPCELSMFCWKLNAPPEGLRTYDLRIDWDLDKARRFSLLMYIGCRTLSYKSTGPGVTGEWGPLGGVSIIGCSFCFSSSFFSVLNRHCETDEHYKSYSWETTIVAREMSRDKR